MQALGAALWAGLIAVVGSFVAETLLSLFVGYVTYSGIDLSLSWLKDFFFSSASGLPASVIGLLGVLKVGTSFSILTAAVSVRFALMGVRNGKISKMVVK